MSKISQLTLKSVLTLLALSTVGAVSTPYALAGAVDAFPSSVNFHQVAVGMSQGQTVHLRNNTREDLHSVRFQEWGDRAQFNVETWSCWSLPSFGSCTVRIEYRPSREGRHNLDVEVWAGGNRTTIRVSGNSYEPRRPPLR